MRFNGLRHVFWRLLRTAGLGLAGLALGPAQASEPRLEAPGAYALAASEAASTADAAALLAVPGSPEWAPASVPAGEWVAVASRPARAQPSKPAWLVLPAAAGRLTSAQIGLVINEDDPYSVEVGAHYIRQRRLREDQVLRLHLPLKTVLTPEEFAPLRRQIELFFGPNTQALALAWRQPWAVNCNSITSAVSLGYQALQCQKLCGPGQMSPYFNEPTAMPFSMLALRPSMLLAASDVVQAKALIDRGVAADGAMTRNQAPKAAAVFARTEDAARNVRSPAFPPAGALAQHRLEVKVEQGIRPRPAGEQLMLYQTGATRVDGLERWHFAPGAVADHLTSFGGVLDGSTGQMPATAWIDAGATASHGTVSEPCNYTQKFPHPQLLLMRLLEGATVLEAYWKSVAWPAQSLFIGEPLAAPYAVEGLR